MTPESSESSIGGGNGEAAPDRRGPVGGVGPVGVGAEAGTKKLDEPKKSAAKTSKASDDSYSFDYAVGFGEGGAAYESLGEGGKTCRKDKLWCCLLPPWQGGGDVGDDDEDGDDADREVKDAVVGPEAELHPASRAHTNRVRGSILRRGGKEAGSVASTIDNSTGSGGSGSGILRRSFLPISSYSSGCGGRPIAPPKKKVQFSPFAHRVNIECWAHDLSDSIKGNLWWQLDDFEQFKMASTTITKSAKLMMKINPDALLSESGNEEHSAASGGSRSGHFKDEKDEKSSKAKWWHKYGHSRRGLEQFVSGEEARQRQTNVMMGRRAVLEEQHRQRRMRRRRGHRPDDDDERIARVAREYSSWAKDLAYAAAMSDADAVKSNFTESRKSREFYLLKHTLGSQGAVPPHTPKFMLPPGVQTRVLDSNTSTSILYRERIVKEEEARRVERRRAREQQMQMQQKQMQQAQGQGQQMQPTAAVRQSVSPPPRTMADFSANSERLAEEAIGKVQRAALGELEEEEENVVGPATTAGDNETGEKRGGVEEEKDGCQLEELNDTSLQRGSSEDLSVRAAGFGGMGGDKVDVGEVMCSYDSSNDVPLPE